MASRGQKPEGANTLDLMEGSTTESLDSGDHTDRLPHKLKERISKLAGNKLSVLFVFDQVSYSK